MKITVKTTQQKIFQVLFPPFFSLIHPTHRTQVEVDPAETVGDLKSKIEQSQGHPVAVQKIIYSGIPFVSHLYISSSLSRKDLDR